MKEIEKARLDEAIRRLSQLAPAMQDVLMAGFDLGRASMEKESDKPKE